MAGECRQFVLCVGPRCAQRADLSQLLKAATSEAAEHSPGWSVGTYACLGRCPTGPNGLVRTLAEGADPNADPGYRDLDAGELHPHLSRTAISQIISRRQARDR